MLKKILIGAAVLVVVVAAALFFLNNRNRTMSPPGSVTLTFGDLTVTIPYSRPSVRGRVIFGTEAENALQPYGKYWRLGANESTEITVSRDVLFNGQPLKAGTYRMYAVPGPETFDIGLNSELGTWGYMEPDYALDVLHTQVPVQKKGSVTELYTITMNARDDGIDAVFEWADVSFTIPITIP